MIIISYSVTFGVHEFNLCLIRIFSSTCQEWDKGIRGTWEVVRTAVGSVTMRMVARGQEKAQLNPVSKHVMLHN